MKSSAITRLIGLLSPRGIRARLSVLIYHRVLTAADPLVPWALGADIFAVHMDALRRYFNVIPLPEAVERLKVGTLPARAAAVTFDDGYRDNLTIALPILQRFRIPATVFVSSGFLDGGRMWNDTVVEAVRASNGTLDLSKLGLGSFELNTMASRVDAIASLLHQMKYLPHVQRAEVAEQIGLHSPATLPNDLMLTADEVRTLHGMGIDIGGHTISHPILSGLDDRSAHQEIAENHRCLSEIIRTPPSIFAYPNGRPGHDYLDTHVRMVRDCGYSGAVSTATGVSTTTVDPYQLYRFTPWDSQSSRFTLRLARNLLTVRSDKKYI